jgi:hypothetical protein
MASGSRAIARVVNLDASQETWVALVAKQKPTCCASPAYGVYGSSCRAVREARPWTAQA